VPREGDQPLGDDDDERGERNPSDRAETERAAAQADRLETHSSRARDAQGVSSTDPTADAGRDADVAAGEPGDAG
jgi:hypothetical protein